MDTWTVELTLRREGKEDVTNTKHIRMDSLTSRMRNISLRNLTAKMTEDFIALLNNEPSEVEDDVRRCGSCGGELTSKLNILTGESYMYCSDCGMGEPE